MESGTNRKWLFRRTVFNLTIGTIVWLIGLARTTLDTHVFSQIDLLILFGITLLTPLTAYATAQPDRNGNLSRLVWLIVYWQPFSAMMTGAALILPTGALAGVLAVGWLLQTGLFFLMGLARWLPRPYTLLEEFCIDAGFIYALVSGIWFVPYRATGTFLSFSGPLVPLTVAHFTFISLGALITAGMIGRQLRSSRTDMPKIYRVSAWAAIISPALVAIGITQTASLGVVSILEVIGVVMLASNYLLLAGIYLIAVRTTINHRVARVILTLSATTLFLTMTLALVYSLGRVTNWWVLAIPDMVRWHGWFNAVGFTGLAVLGWSLAPTISHIHPGGIPFSRLTGRGRIGAGFFETLGVIATADQSPTGIADDLGDYGAPDCQIEQLEPHVRAFYEHTAQHQLRVYPQWNRRFHIPARLYKWFSRRVEQMNLPLEPERDDALIHSEIVALNDAMDGRERVRGWVRTYANTGVVVYVAAYANHTSKGQRYMNIAFPLPGGNLTSVLRLQTFAEKGAAVLHLTSISDENTRGDQGVYFVTSPLPVRLPMSETIDVYPLPYPDFPDVSGCGDRICAYARHRMWLFGFHFLTLHYTLWPSQSR